MQDKSVKFEPVPTKTTELAVDNDGGSDNEDNEVIEVNWKNQHKNLGDGGFRAAILGFSDGMVSNLLLILGVQFAVEGGQGEGGDVSASIVETGIAGVVASSFSMGIGEWISMKNQSEALRGEVQTQQSHLERFWEEESKHFLQILADHGISDESQKLVKDDLATAPKDKVINFQLKMDLGIDPEDTGNPLKASAFSALFVAIGSFIPVFPYTFLHHSTAWIVALCLAAICGFGLGVATGKLSGTNIFKAAARQILGIAIVVGIAIIVNLYLVSLVG